MLTMLVIKNFVMVEHAQINLQKGFTVITGETGSGKSLLLSAIRLAFGGRADVQTVKTGAAQASIQLTISLLGLPQAQQWLTLNGYEMDAKGLVTIERTIYTTGRSKNTLNGKTASTTQLKNLSNHILQVHGQHQQQALLKTTEQMRLLDAYAQSKPYLQDTNTAYSQWLSLIERREMLQKNVQQSGEIALLRYQSDELNALGLDEGEWEQLSNQHKQLSNVTAHKEACAKALDLLEAEDGMAVLNALQLVHSTIEPLALPDLPDLLESAQINLSEAIDTLKRQLDSFEADPERLHQIDTRLSLLYDMARKHHIKPEALYQHAQLLQDKLESNENVAKDLESIDAQITSAAQHYFEKAKVLSALRIKAAKKLSSLITDRLQPLGMAGSTFSINLAWPKEAHPAPGGADTITFSIQTNPDQPLLPINKVASGGELSRVALAIQAISAEHLSTPSLIFDEVDVGIGGQTGTTVGATLKALASKGQVLCVTHLPQVAAFADHHIQILKSVKNKTTHIDIIPLDSKECVNAIAVMLGGNALSEQAKAHAESLLQQASMV